MACSLLTRIFHRRRSADTAVASTTPPLIHSASTPLSPSFTVLGFRPANSLHPLPEITLPADHLDGSISNLLLMNEMAGQGPSSLGVYNLNHNSNMTFPEIGRIFRLEPGYLNLRAFHVDTEDGASVLSHCVLDFRTATDAANARAQHPQVVINGHTYPVVPFSEDTMNAAFGAPQYSLTEPGATRNREQDPPSNEERDRKRLKMEPPEPPKPQCKICYTDLEGAYSTPCRHCKSPRCFDCLKREFEVAMTDMERMPAKCCRVVLHHQVVEKILEPATVEAYKSKFDQQNTANPLYCPVPTCSTFIPPRMFSKTKTKVSCPVCLAVVCIKCKQPANRDHTCKSLEEHQIILQTWEYKPCPKCGTGVMKMFGCPHVRCQCGAHWCWDCRRPMNACYQKPCRAAREDGQESEGGAVDDSDSEIGTESLLTRSMVQTEETTTSFANGNEGREIGDETAGPDSSSRPETTITPSPTDSNDSNQTTASAPPAADTTANLATAPEPGTNTTADEEVAGTTVPPVEHLDDPDEFDWEGQSLDFGEEPADESWDIWGCRHGFRFFEKQHIPEFWVYGLDPRTPEAIEVDCMSCFKKAKVWETLVMDKSDAEAALATAKKTEENDNNGEIPTEEAQAVKEKVQKAKRIEKARFAFECHFCGVIYCGSCKRAAIKKMRKDIVVDTGA